MTRRATSRFKAAVAGAAAWVNDIRYTNDGIHWSDPLKLEAGTVVEDQTSQVRWTCDLTVHNTPVGDHGLNPYTSHLRVRHGIQYGPRDVELVGLGVYRIDRVRRSKDSPDMIKISGKSFEQALIDATFTSPRKLLASSPSGRITDLITEVLPDVTVWVDPRIDDDDMLPAVTVESSRWDAIDGGRTAGSAAKAIAAQVYANGDGVFMITPVSTLADEPVWRAQAGPGGVLISSEDELTSEGVYNQVIVTGQSTGGIIPVGPVIISDDDIWSRTYYKGRFGPRPTEYTNPNITRFRQADKAGRAWLAAHLGLRQQVTFDQLHDPTLAAGDVGLVDVAAGRQRTILDSVTFDLLGGQLQTTTRATIVQHSDEKAGDILTQEDFDALQGLAS